MSPSPHPLKLISLASLLALFLSQVSLVFWLDSELELVVAGLLALPLLVPLRGLIGGRRYTYKWVGFLTLLYLAIGISESFSNPQLRFYGVLTITFSCMLFLSSIYYSRSIR